MLTKQLQKFCNVFLKISNFLIFIIFFHHNFQHAKANMFIYGGCSQDKYQQNSPYAISLNALLSSMATSASQALYNSFVMGNDTSASANQASVFGLYQCRGDLKMNDCSTCIASLVGQIELVCPSSYGASLQLDVCFVRYEHDNFLGKLDTTLRYKKCSTSIRNDVEFLKRRDIVLANMQASILNSWFRVSSSGSVEGYAQCDGDLIASDCTSCLSVAIKQLKSSCESAAAGDVFLAKCYARYWASGYYGSSESYKDDDVGKTVAIIVGVVAGVSIIIVLLSVCRQSIDK